MNRIQLSVLLLAALSAPSALGDSVSIRSVKDNTLYEDPDGLLSNGSGPVMFVGETGSSGSRRGLLEFDIASNLPLGATINSVSLRMYCSRTTSGSKRIELHRVLQEWGEGASAAGDEFSGGGGGGGSAQAGDATWRHTYYSNSFWTNPGGDYSATNSGDTLVGAVGYYTWSTAGMKTDVENWRNDANANHGWLMLGIENGSRSSKRFNTREAITSGSQPTLTIDYTPAPEPATAVLLAGGLLAAARRR